MKDYSRRHFCKTGALVLGASAGLSVLPRPLHAILGSTPEPVPPIRDPRIKALALRAIEAARTAGATYADIRLTRTHQRLSLNAGLMHDSDALHVGIRALVDGYWGFAASAVWSPDEVVRLGREAVRQAKANTLGKVRDVVLPPVPVIEDGHWETPIKIDPWTISVVEIADVLTSINNTISRELRDRDRFGRLESANINTKVLLYLSEQAFAATTGSYYTQRLHWTEGSCSIQASQGEKLVIGNDGGLLTPTAAGWEHVIEQPVVETVLRSVDEHNALQELPVKHVDVGVYDVVFDAASVTKLISRTIGAATEIDRMFGYEANSGGTSYLRDPGEVLGTYEVGAPLLTVTANRTEAGGAATVRWDSEGVAAQEFSLIEQGKVAGFQMNQEGTGWVRDVYTKAGLPVQSNGCAFAQTGKDVPMIHTPNLVMTPGTAATTLQDLEAGIGNGISFSQFDPEVDFQCSSGVGAGRALEIRNGKRVARIEGAVGVLFRTQELWKNLTAIGGPSSATRRGAGFFWLDYGTVVRKGQPEQFGCQSVTAVPIAVKTMSVIDRERR